MTMKNTVLPILFTVFLIYGLLQTGGAILSEPKSQREDDIESCRAFVGAISLVLCFICCVFALKREDSDG